MAVVIGIEEAILPVHQASVSRGSPLGARLGWGAWSYGLPSTTRLTGHTTNLCCSGTDPLQ